MVTAWLCCPKKEFSILATPHIPRKYYRTVIYQVHRRDQLNSKVQYRLQMLQNLKFQMLSDPEFRVLLSPELQSFLNPWSH